jgi:hypothetical protein
MNAQSVMSNRKVVAGAEYGDVTGVATRQEVGGRPTAAKSVGTSGAAASGA